MKRCALLVSLFLLCLPTAEPLLAQPETQQVRVAIIKDSSEFSLAIKGEFKIVDRSLSNIASKQKLNRETKVTLTEQGFKLGPQEFLTSPIKIIPKKDATIYVNGRRFRGKIDIFRDSQKRLMVINTVELENYIKGVLYHEVSHYWPMESLKAQAIAVRSYALYQMKLNKNKNFDVTNDIYSQVYGGRGSERYRTNIAVVKTKGLVLAYQGKLLLAYFHATCAGHTEDVSKLWKQDLPPLKGVVCNFCRYSPHSRWKKNFRLKDIQDKLNEKGYDLGLIKEIRVVERNRSDRIRTLEIETRDEKTINISGKDFREIIGPNLVRSNNYAIDMQGYYMDLIGKGWGHGVGMCQWGASQMAAEGYSHDQILKYYYPGVDIVNYETAGF